MKNLLGVMLLTCSVLLGCSPAKKSLSPKVNKEGVALKSKVELKGKIPAKTIFTGDASADEVVSFAETLRGTPYKYGSAVPAQGLDCSGFIYYVFGKFKISVPRTSKDFTNAGTPVSTLESKRGDIILFTGSDANSGVVGHMGFITKNQNGVLQFIHAASGSGGGVMISTMNSYFLPRFVKVIRVFKIF